MTDEVGRMDGMGGQLTFCERVTATPTSPNHIRRVGDEGLKFGGGAPDTTLCGRLLNKGWDLPGPVTDRLVRLLSTPREGDAQVFVCRDCADTYMGSLR